MLSDARIDIFKEEGETHTTRIIRMQTKIGLRDKDFTLMHLPSYYSKRQIYERFCFVSGWEVKPASDRSYPPVAELKKRDNDNEDISDERMSLWPEGSESLPVCSWCTFLKNLEALSSKLKDLFIIAQYL